MSDLWWVILAVSASLSSAYFWMRWWQLRPKSTRIGSRITKLSATTTPSSWRGDVGSFKVRDSDFHGQGASPGAGESHQ